MLKLGVRAMRQAPTIAVFGLLGAGSPTPTMRSTAPSPPRMAGLRTFRPRTRSPACSRSISQGRGRRRAESGLTRPSAKQLLAKTRNMCYQYSTGRNLSRLGERRRMRMRRNAVDLDGSCHSRQPPDCDPGGRSDRESSSPDGGCRRAGFPIGRCAAVGNDKGNRSGGFWMRRLAHNLRRGPKFSYLNRP